MRQKICVRCGKDFFQKSNIQKYCSRNCAISKEPFKNVTKEISPEANVSNAYQLLIAHALTTKNDVMFRHLTMSYMNHKKGGLIK